MRPRLEPVRSRAARLAGCVVLLWPTAANACAVCGANTDRNQKAQLVMSIVLSLLPLTMLGAGAVWMRRRIRAVEARDREAVDGSGTSTGPAASLFVRGPTGRP